MENLRYVCKGFREIWPACGSSSEASEASDRISAVDQAVADGQH
jgi:hypothetical protein